MDIKEGDVFSFRYSEAMRDKAREHHNDLNWCFDGKLEAIKQRDGSTLLRDIFWESGDSRTFTVERAKAEGELCFMFNKADVEPIREHETRYYDAADWWDFSSQHGCRKRFVLRKGAQRSQAAMLKAADEQLQKEAFNRERANRRIEHLLEDRAKIEAGDLNVYL